MNPLTPLPVALSSSFRGSSSARICRASGDSRACTSALSNCLWYCCCGFSISSLLHEPANAAAGGAEFVVQGIVERQDLPRLGRQPRLHFGAQQLLVVLLLRLLDQLLTS